MWMAHKSPTLGTDHNIRQYRCYYPGWYPVCKLPLLRYPDLGWFVCTVPLDKQHVLLYIMWPSTLCNLHIVTLLVMNPIYMMKSLSLYLTSLLFSVALLSLTAQRHCFRIHLFLQREKPHLKIEGVKTQRDPHMVYRVQLQREIHQVYFIFR